jgi:uncharacterized protein (TIGR03437 family)
LRCFVSLALFTCAIPWLKAQTACGNVTVGLSSDGQSLIGASDGGTSYSWSVNNQTVTQGGMSQLALFHFENGLSSTSGVAPTKTVGNSYFTGKWGAGLGIANGGVVTYPAAGNLSFQDGTIETWISPRSDGSDPIYKQYNHSFLRYVASNGDQLMLSEGPNGALYGGTVVGGKYTGAGGSSVFNWKAGEWHHVALTYSVGQKRVRLYLDGGLILEKNATIPMPASNGSFSVASDPFGKASWFVVDEMRISSAEKTAQDINTDAKRTGPFGNNEIRIGLNSIPAGQVGYQVSGATGACGTASYNYAAVSISNITPQSGLLPPGSTGLSLSFTTAQPASCRYSLGTLLDYNSMTPFDSESASTHIGQLSGLSSDPRVLNHVYLRCSSDPNSAILLEYRAVAALNGSFPRIGSIWTGSYIYRTDPARAAKIQLFLGPGFSVDDAAAIRSKNPNALILPNVNATETTPGFPVIPDNYYLKDIHGNKIQHWPGDYILNLTMPEVADYLAQYAYQMLAQSNFAFDGVFFDNFRTTISTMTKDAWGNPVQIDANNDGIADDPSTLDAAWSTGVYREMTSLRKLLPYGYLSGHLGGSPPAPQSLADFNGDSLAFYAVNVREGTMAFGDLWNTYQTWLSQGQSPVITMMQSSPPNLIAYGYGFTPLSVISPQTADFGRTFYPNMRFGLATSLMNDGFSTYDFGDTGAPVSWWYDEYDFNLGTPLGPAKQMAAGQLTSLLTNGSFESGLSNWSLLVTNDGVSRATLAPDSAIVADGASSAHITVASASSTNWHVSFEQQNVSLTAGTNYQLQFWARSDIPRTIAVHAQGGAPSYAFYGLSTSIAIDTTWRLYSASFIAPITAKDARIQFRVGNVAGQVWLDGVILAKPLPYIYRRDFTNGVVLLNGTASPQTVSLEAGLNRFVGSQAPKYQNIIDDVSPTFTSSGSWATVTYDTGYTTEVANGPYYHAWNSTCHQLNTSTGSAQWNLGIGENGSYTIQVWLPAAPSAGGWTKSAVYEVVSGGSVIASATVDQTAASSGDGWRTIATVNLIAASSPILRVRNGSSTGSLIADAVYVTSAALYNDGSPATQITLNPMDGILLKRQQPVAAAASKITSVVSSASGRAVTASSGTLSILGSGFGATSRAWSSADFKNGQLPTSLDGISATVNNKPAFIGAISPTQLNVIAPDDDSTGALDVQIKTPKGASHVASVVKQKMAPAFFTMTAGPTLYVDAKHADGAPVGPPVPTMSPAKPGEVITLIATGLGSTSPPTPASQTVSAFTPVTASVAVSIGRVNATVVAAGKVSPGCYQITVKVPVVPAGNQPIVVNVGGFQSGSGVVLPVLSSQSAR